MTAFAMFLISISFMLTFFNIFPHWKPEEPEWLNKAVEYMTRPFIIAFVFVVGIGLLYLFG